MCYCSLAAKNSLVKLYWKTGLKQGLYSIFGASSRHLSLTVSVLTLSV